MPVLSSRIFRESKIYQMALYSWLYEVGSSKTSSLGSGSKMDNSRLARVAYRGWPIREVGGGVVATLGVSFALMAHSCDIMCNKSPAGRS
jgi:hypothetical protein